MRIVFHDARVVALLLLIAAPGHSAASMTATRSLEIHDERPGAGFLLEEPGPAASASDSMDVRPTAQLALPASLHYDEDHTSLRRATRITLVTAAALAGVAVVWGTVRLLQDMIQ